MVNGNLDQVEIQFAICEYDNGKRAKCYGYYPNYHPAEEMQKIRIFERQAFYCRKCGQTLMRRHINEEMRKVQE